MKNFGSFLPPVEAVRLSAEVTKTVFASNQNMPECRRVTPGAANTVVERSLVASAGLPDSLRHHLALVALSNYVALAQHDRSRTEFAIDTDLLPVAHPRSSRRHALTASALREARARWIVSDPRIDEDHRPLVAAALTAEPGSVEHFYAVSRLEAAQDGIALRALLASFGDGNSSAARSARARRQRRDRKGRFAWMGGGMRALIRRLSGGGVESFTGKFVKEADNGDFFEMQAPNGRIYQVPASRAEALKATLPSSGDGYAGVPAKISSENASAVIDENDLVELNAPSGYQEIGENLWQTDGAQDYRVEKLPDGKFRVSRNDPEDTEVGVFDDWADAHRGLVKDGKRANKADAVKARLGGSKGRDAEYNDFKGGLEAEADDPDGDYRKAAKAALDYFEFGDTPEGESAAQLADRLEKNAAAAAEDGDEDLAEDLRDAAEEVRYRAARGAADDAADAAPEFAVPEGAFALKRADINDFTPRGRTNQDSPDYTDDPAELAQRFDADTLREGLADALNGNGQGNMPFDQDEKVPAAALYRAMQEKGLDADAEVASVYDAGFANGETPNADILKDADSLEQKATLPSEEKVAELPQQQRDADVEDTAAKLHDIWREGRRNEDGTYEPRMKDDGQGGEVDIANTDYADLPEKWQAENRASADHVVNLLRNEQAPADADPIEWAAEEVHKSWLERNGSWAPEEQKLPYSELSEEEKQKDRDVVQAALDTLGLDSPKQEATPDQPEGEATPETVSELPEETPEPETVPSPDMVETVPSPQDETRLDPDMVETVPSPQDESIDIVPSSVELRMTTDEDPPVVPGEADPYADEDFPPTQEQKDIVDAVLTGDDVVVRALAGTGKTSTLKLIARRLKKDSPLKKIIYIAFNKSVQVEAEAKMPDNVESRTADSIAWRWADKKITGKRNKKDNIVKIKDIAAHLGVDNIPDPNNPGEWFSPTEAVVYARKAVDKFTISADDEIGPQHFEGGSSPELLDLAKRMWADYSSPEGRLGIKNNHVTKMWALSRPDLSDSASGVTKGADIIFFDEAQDINPVLAKVVADQKIQKIYVGDENQAIYGFRGAEDELQNVKAPHDLALTKSWRFGPQIAGMGNRFLEFLGSKRRVEGGGPDGEILDSGTMEDADAILVRTNAGALQAIMEELDRGRSVGVAAKYKEELQRLVDTAEWLKNGGDPRSKPRDIHEDLVQFSSWKEVLDASKEENANYDPKVAMLAGMVESQGIDGMRDILDRVKIASSKEDGNEAGVAPLTQADAEDGASGKIADGVDYKIEGSKIVLSGKGMFPVKDKLKASGFRWNPEGKTWWRNEDSPEERLTMLTNLRNKVGGVVEAQPIDVVVSTAHKAKGLEWDRVRIGDDFRKPKENEFGQPMIAPEEVRLAYVAVTRARKALDPGSLDWIYKYEGRNLNPNQDETTETPSASPDQPDAPDTEAPGVPARPSFDYNSAEELADLSDEELNQKIQQADEYERLAFAGQYPIYWDELAENEEALRRERRIRDANLSNEDANRARSISEKIRKSINRHANITDPDAKLNALRDLDQEVGKFLDIVDSRGDRPEPEGEIPVEDAPNADIARRETRQPADLQPGDVVITERRGGREYFIVDEVAEGGDKGKLIVRGHYPGHAIQEKQWNPKLRKGQALQVVRGAEVPPPGDGPELHKPDIKDYLEKDADGNVKKGQWVKDENDEWYVPNPEKQAEYQAALNPVLDQIVEASKGFNDPTRGETVPPAPKPLKAPFAPGAAPLQGRLAEIAREANGDPQRMRELLSQENVYVFDFETTGIEKDEFGAMVSPGQPWSIAVSKIDPMTGEVVETRSIFMNPGAPLSDWAKANLRDADGNPLTDEWLATQRSKEDAFREALDFIGENAILIGHNIDFDEPILRENADEYDLPYAPAGLGDTMSLSRYLQREDRFSKNALGDLAKKYGIENPDWHNAENDVAITAKIFDALLTDFQERGEPIDIDAISEWQRGREEEFDAKQKKFADDLAQRKVDELVAEALHSEEKPDIDKAVEEVAQETQRSGEAASGGEDDEDLDDFFADILAEEDNIPEMGERPNFTGEVIDFDRGVHIVLDNGDKISVIDDGFGRKESAYLKWNEATKTHKLLHADIRKWDEGMSDEEIARQHLDALYGSPEAPTVDPDAESNIPEDVDLGDIVLPETDDLAGVKDAAGRAEAALDEALDGVEVDSEINELVGNVRSLRQELDAAQNDREALDLGRDLADALDDLGEALYDALPRENGLADRARDLREDLRGLRRKNRKRARGRDVQRPAEPPAANAPENIEQEVPTRGQVPKRAADNGGVPSNEPTSVNNVGDFGVGVRTPAAPGDRPSGITNGRDLPGAMPAGPDEPQGPDGRRLLRRGRENRRFWDHPLFERWLNGGRAVFNRPWEGQFVDRNNIPLAGGDTVLYIGPGKNKGRVGIIVGREDNMERNDRLHRDYVLVRFGKDKDVVPLKSRNFILDPDEDTDWRFLVDPDEVPNDPAEERINLPAGFDWNQVRRGAAPQNTRGKGGELRGEGRDANNVPIAPGDALAQQERHELEGHLADDDGFILFEGDRVQIVKAVKGKPGPIFGEVVGKKYIPRYNKDGERVGYGYYALIRLEDGTIIPRTAKSLRILDIPEGEKAARRPDNPKASLPTLKKEGGKWVPDKEDEGEPPVRELPPRKATLQNAAFTAAGDLAQVLDYQISPNLKGQDFLQQAQELRERAEALRVLINNGEEDQVVGEAVRDLADAAHVFGDRIRADRDNNAEINGKSPADALNGFGDNFEMLADGLTTSPKPRRGKWMPDGLEHRTDLTEDQVRVGDFVSLPNVGGAKVIEITNNDGLQQRSFLVEDEAGRRTVLVTGYGAKFPVPVLRKLDKKAKPDPFIPRNVKREDIPAKQIQVGDFVAMKNGYGLVISKEVSDRNGAVKLKFRFNNGREWQADWWSGNLLLRDALISPREDQPGAAPAPAQPSANAPQPQVPAMPSQGTVALDRAGNPLSVGSRVRHRNEDKYGPRGEAVVKSIKKDKDGRTIVKVQFADGSMANFKSEFLSAVQDENAANKRTPRPAANYRDALKEMQSRLGNRGDGIGEVLNKNGDIADIDLPTRAAILKEINSAMEMAVSRGEDAMLRNLMLLSRDLTNAHVEQYPSPEALGEVGDLLLTMDMDNVIRQIKANPDFLRAGKKTAGIDIPLVNPDGSPSEWQVKTLRMGNIGFTFMMVHSSGQRFIVKKEVDEDKARQEVIGAAVARGLGIPGATYARLHTLDGTISVQTYAGNGQPLKVDFAKNAAMYAGNLRSDDMWFQHAADFVLLDALIHNGDRHESNYLMAELDAGNEEILMPFPIDMAKPWGNFDLRDKQPGNSWSSVKSGNKHKFTPLGRKNMEQIADMSVQQLMQYLQRFMQDHPDGVTLRKMAETILERAKNAVQDPYTVYGV